MKTYPGTQEARVAFAWLLHLNHCRLYSSDNFSLLFPTQLRICVQTQMELSITISTMNNVTDKQNHVSTFENIKLVKGGLNHRNLFKQAN